MSEQNPWENQRPEGGAPVPPQPQFDEFGNPIAPQPVVEETAVFSTPEVPQAPVAPAFEQPAAPAQPQYGAYAQPQQPTGFEQPAAPAQPQYGAYGQPQQPASFEPAGAPYAAAAAAASAALPGQAPYGVPGQAGAYPAGQPGGSAVPGRGKSITMIVLGLVMMFILAPISLFVGLAVGAVQSAPGLLGNEVVVDKFPTVQVSITGPNANHAVCGLIGENGIIDLYSEGNGTFVNKNVPAGTYEVACDNITDADTVVAVSGDDAFGVLANGWSIAGFIGSFVIGLVGFILLILGIVKLVKVNKQRKLAANPYGW